MLCKPPCVALPGHLGLDLFYPEERAGCSHDIGGTWRGCFVTCCPGGNFLWSVRGWHGSGISGADVHGAVLASGELGQEPCAWHPSKQRAASPSCHLERVWSFST